MVSLAVSLQMLSFLLQILAVTALFLRLNWKVWAKKRWMIVKGYDRVYCTLVLHVLTSAVCHLLANMLCWSVSQAQLLLVVSLLVFVILTGYLHFIIYSIFVYSFIFFIFFLFIWWVIFSCKFYVNFLLFSHVVDDSCCTCTHHWLVLYMLYPCNLAGVDVSSFSPY